MVTKKQKHMPDRNKKAVLELEVKLINREPCAKGHCHYWMIETPKGPKSEGVCKFCGDIREFDNFGPDFYWGGDKPGTLVPCLPDLSKDKEKG